uniref:Uncharacterized protein n=1 Tax=Aegilops tauschii subsp. strangulata TaxID=200361 RepID=A0A453EGK7_AEGTS
MLPRWAAAADKPMHLAAISTLGRVLLPSTTITTCVVSHHHPDVATMGGGSGQTNAPCGDIYVREGVVAVHHDNNLCCVDFRFFGDELDYIPLKATYPAHERGYLKTILELFLQDNYAWIHKCMQLPSNGG